MNRCKWRLMFPVLLAAVFLFLSAAPGEGAKYPDKPIKIVVPTGPGGSADLHARAVASVIHQYIGQPMIVQLMGGGGGSQGMNHVFRAKPDGYTILFTVGAQTGIIPHVKKVKYDPLKDFVPIFKVNNADYMMVSSAKNSWKNFDEFVGAIQKNPGKISYGSSGMYGPGHTMILQIMADKKVNINHVPFKGGGPAMRAMLGGHVHSAGALPATGGVLGLYRAKKVRVLAVAAEKRNPLFPDAPTFKEKGVDFVYSMWRGFLAPKGMAQEKVDVLVKGFQKMSKDKTFRNLLKKMGEKPNTLHGPAFKKLMADEYNRFGKIFQRIGLKKK